jgi:hypothetical protein
MQRALLVALLLAQSCTQAALGAKPRLPPGRAVASKAQPLSGPAKKNLNDEQQPAGRVQLRLRADASLSRPPPALPPALLPRRISAEVSAPPLPKLLLGGDSEQTRLGDLDAGALQSAALRSARRARDVDGYRTVAGGAVVHLVFGALYCWGNFNAYAPSRLRFFDGEMEHQSGAVPDILTVWCYD